MRFQLSKRKRITLIILGAILIALPLTLFLLTQNQDIRQRAAVDLNPYWTPALNSSWQWQLTGTVDQSLNVHMYDIDGFDNTAATVASLHAKGARVVCYISAGSAENWRPDYASFPVSVKGKPLDGWAGETWLDIRNLSVLGPIMQARMDMCKAKGFDAVEPDNIDGYTNNTGFPLTAQDQITYNKFLAEQAHARGMSIALKNDNDQAAALLPYFDFALNEECFRYNECDYLKTFVDAGKAVFQVEYNLATSQFCPQANAMNINSLKKDLNLSATRTACRESGSPSGPVTTIAPSPSGISLPVGDLTGWKQIFIDDFTTPAALGQFPGTNYSASWSVYPDGWKDTSKNGTYMPSKVLSVANGMLDMYLHSENGVPMVAAPLPNKGIDQLYGRYSVAFRADAVTGYKTAWLLWPDSEVWPRDGEIDFPEGNLNGTIDAYMHRQNATTGSDQDAFSTTTTFTSWHVATTEWTPTKVTFILDGQVIGTSTNRIPNTPMHWVLQTETALDGTVPSNTASGHVQVDWVAMWQYNPTTPNPTTSISQAPTTSPTASGTNLNLTVKFHGLGNAGDNANPTGGNPTPKRTTRPVSVSLMNSTGNAIATILGSVIYQSTTKVFTGTIQIPSTLTPNAYRVRLSSPGYLTEYIPGIYTLPGNSLVSASTVSLIAGDATTDNVLDVLDYNSIMDCWLTTTCSADKKLLSDIDDTGEVNVTDYNLFIRELSVQKGQ